MKKISILILVFSALSLWAQPAGIDCQKDVFSPLGIDESKSKECTWQSIGPDGGYVNSLAFNPKNHSEIYATVYGYPGRIYKTVDSGKTWEIIATLESDLGDIAVDAKNSDVIYVLGGPKIFKSEDAGQNWEEYSFMSFSSSDENVYSSEGLVIDPIYSNVLYTGGYFHNQRTSNQGMAVLKSVNGGKEWQVIKLTPNSIQGRVCCVAIDLVSPNVIYAGGFYNDGSNAYFPVFRSSDGGKNWINISANIFRASPNSIAVDPRNSSKLYVANYQGIFRSSDGGQTWKKNDGFAYGYKIAIDPADSNILYAGYSNAFYKSVDGGVNWTYSDGPKGLCTSLLATFYQSLSSQFQVYSNSTQVYYGSDAGIYKSGDGGILWKESHKGICSLIIPALAIAPSSPNVIYIFVEGSGLFWSNNFGKSWKRLPFSLDINITKIAVNSKNPDNLIILTGASPECFSCG